MSMYNEVGIGMRHIFQLVETIELTGSIVRMFLIFDLISFI